MVNINQILRNLRRKGIENKNELCCPECKYPIDTEYLFDAMNDGEYSIFWKHEVTKKNTNGEDVTILEYKAYPQNSNQVPAYLEINTWCRCTDDDGDYNCEHTFKVRYHIISQEIID